MPATQTSGNGGFCRNPFDVEHCIPPSNPTHPPHPPTHLLCTPPAHLLQTSGNDVFYRNPFNVEENLFVDVSSPSSSKYDSVADLGSPEDAAARTLEQVLFRAGVEGPWAVLWEWWQSLGAWGKRRRARWSRCGHVWGGIGRGQLRLGCALKRVVKLRSPGDAAARTLEQVRVCAWGCGRRGVLCCGAGLCLGQGDGPGKPRRCSCCAGWRRCACVGGVLWGAAVLGRGCQTSGSRKNWPAGMLSRARTCTLEGAFVWV